MEKPRIGGGFGAKQTAVSEVYPAFVTLKTGRPAQLIFTREESQIAGSPRHEMEVRVRLGADKDGHIRGLDLYTLSNSGAYGEHGPTTVGLSGHKSIPLYTGGLEAFGLAMMLYIPIRWQQVLLSGLRSDPGYFCTGNLCQRAGREAWNRSDNHPGKEYAPGGHENAGLLWRNCKCLCVGQMHGAL